MQRALRAWLRQRGATQHSAGDADDETATRALIRPINKRRAKYAVYAIVAEEVDFALLGLYHGTSMRILLEKLEPHERAQRQPKLICTTDALGEIASTDALPSLKQALNDPAVSARAQWAISEIEGE